MVTQHSRLPSMSSGVGTVHAYRNGYGYKKSENSTERYEQPTKIPNKLPSSQSLVSST